jgi:hypothetical protein
MTRISDDSLVTGFGEELLEDKGTSIPAISCDSKKKNKMCAVDNKKSNFKMFIVALLG